MITSCFYLTTKLPQSDNIKPVFSYQPVFSSSRTRHRRERPMLVSGLCCEAPRLNSLHPTVRTKIRTAKEGLLWRHTPTRITKSKCLRETTAISSRQAQNLNLCTDT